MSAPPSQAWPSPPAHLLRRLLSLRGVAVPTHAAEQAWREAFHQAPREADQPAQAKALEVAMRRWVRPFDGSAEVAVVSVSALLPQHCPVLVLHEGQWRVAHHLRGYRLGLERDDGSVHDIDLTA